MLTAADHAAMIAAFANCTVTIGSNPGCAAEFTAPSKTIMPESGGIISNVPVLLLLAADMAADIPVYETPVTVSGSPSGDGDYSVTEILPDGAGFMQIFLTKADQ